MLKAPTFQASRYFCHYLVDLLKAIQITGNVVERKTRIIKISAPLLYT